MTKHPLRLTACCRGSHVEVIARARDALGASGASILDFHMFSNAVLCLNFEIAARLVPALLEAIAQADICFDPQSLHDAEQLIEETRARGRLVVEGSLSINLINDEPVLRCVVPAVPG